MAERVLIFSTAYLPLVGGAELAIKEITDRLPEIEFDLICAKLDPRLSDTEKIGNVMVYRIGSGQRLADKLLVPWRGATMAAALHKKHPYTYFWCMMATYASGAAYIYNIFHPHNRVPIALTLQEGDSEAHLKYRWGGMIDLSWRMALRRTTVLTTISRYLMTRAENLGYKGRAELIPNGVDTKLFTKEYSLEELDALKRQLGKKEEDKYLITTSRLNVKNAVGDVMESLTRLPEHVKFLVLGTGELEKQLKDQVKKLRLEDRVKFLGLIPHAEMPKYLKISDIFIRPSLSEGMGNSFIEAMAAGLPVIATPVGGIPDFLFDPDKDHDMPPTGLFVNVRDPKNIAVQVERLLSDSALRQKLVENAKKLVIEKYDWNLIAEEMKNRVFESA